MFYVIFGCIFVILGGILFRVYESVNSLFTLIFYGGKHMSIFRKKEITVPVNDSGGMKKS